MQFTLQFDFTPKRIELWWPDLCARLRRFVEQRQEPRLPDDSGSAVYGGSQFREISGVADVCPHGQQNEGGHHDQIEQVGDGVKADHGENLEQ